MSCPLLGDYLQKFCYGACSVCNAIELGGDLITNYSLKSYSSSKQNAIALYANPVFMRAILIRHAKSDLRTTRTHINSIAFVICCGEAELRRDYSSQNNFNNEIK